MDKKSFNEVKALLTDKLGNPFYETDKAIIFNADAIDVFKKLNFSFVDLTVTSPPYNIGKEYEKIKPIEEYINWTTQWIEGLYSITNDNGAMFTQCWLCIN